ncbi:hypothetical protein OfM2_06740 [Lactovum odontotermitis]
MKIGALNQKEKLQIFHSAFYVSVGFLCLTLFTQVCKIIYLIFIKNEKDLTEENRTIFVIFFVFLLFSLVWKILVQKISNEESAAAEKTLKEDIQTTKQESE